MDTLDRIGGIFGELGGGAGALLTGESPAATKSRDFLGRLLTLVMESPELKAQFVEALEALKNTEDEVWRDTKLLDRLQMSATLGIFLALVKK